MQINSAIAEAFSELLAIYYFKALWTSPETPDHSQKKQQNQTVTSMNI